MEQPGERGRWAEWFRRAGAAYIAFAIAAISFITATVYTDVRVRQLDALQNDTSENALPSVYHLSEAREELRHIERIAATAHDDDIAASLRAIDAHTAAYLQTAMYPGEQDLWDKAKKELDAVSAAATRRMEARTHGARTAATTALREAAKRADLALDEDATLNAKGGDASSISYNTLSKKVSETAYILDALSFFVALLATFIAYHSARRYQRLLEDRTRELERFADRVAHDLRAPLAPPLMALSMAATALPADHPVQRAVARGKQSLQLSASIVEALLGFARSGARPAPGGHASLKAAVAGVMDEASHDASEARVALRVERFDDVSVGCAPGVLASILSNLVHNGIKHMGDASEREVSLHVTAEDRRVRVEVHDTGPGVPKNATDTIFEPHIRAAGPSVAGLGLGLATVKRLVDAHGGDVGLISKPGHTCFWFVLSRAVDDGPPMQAPAAVPH
jgi:signal transduction histidine kinase